MAQLNVPSADNTRRISYSDLKGVDLSLDPALVDRRRSPDALNMISDNGGNPIKRKGWERLFDDDAVEPVDNLWSFWEDGERYFIVARGDYIYELKRTYNDAEGDWDYELSSNKVPCASGKKLGYFMQSANQDAFYIFCKDQFYEVVPVEENGEKVLKFSDLLNPVDDNAPRPFVPTLFISKNPTGGGTYFQDINRLTREVKEEFLNQKDSSDAYSKTFLCSGQVDLTKPHKCEYVNSNGDWVALTYTTNANPTSGQYTITGATFKTGVAYEPVVVGADNIRVQYFLQGDGTADRVLGCKVGNHFSKEVADQYFISGNEKYPQYVYYSDTDNPTYYPENNYLFIGGSSTRVMGFLNIGSYLAVIKEQASDDSTVYLIYKTSYKTTSVTTNATTITTTEYNFSIQRATTGVGAISHYCFATLNDEPLFFSRYGVHGIVSTNTTSEKIVRNRSYFVDAKLTKEPDLDKAVAIEWNNYYILCVNSHAYVLDGRQKSSNSTGNTNYSYEAYYWENIPANCFLTFDDELWFGTSDGDVCRFKNSGNASDYSDNTIHKNTNITGSPIVARWSTPNDNDGLSEYYKTMMKKGSMCTVAPHHRSSVNAYIAVDGYGRKKIGDTLEIGMFTGFDNIDFANFSFDARKSPRDDFFRKKQKKYKRLQIILENDRINEPFGVFEIVKTYLVTRYAKR